ncbi:MAG: hypothetical protein SFW67_28530 [Myxococcaceae bacterium]|nr:hypothetical protein [Myxococcaceae bacterium]
MLVSVGVFTLAGVGIYVATPQPATRSMAELRDAGITDGQRVVLTCPERLTPRTKRRINDGQPGVLRPKQTYARIARTAVCFNPDGGNCLRPSDGVARVGDLQAELIVPSLRRDMVGLDPDGGEDAVDDSFQFRNDDCTLTTCASFDAGDGSNFCGRLNRLRLVDPPCMIPNGWRADGGWCEEACGVVDCRMVESDGGSRWYGFNVMRREQATGSACVPVECSVVAGDVPQDWL